MKASGASDPWDTPCKGVCTATALGDPVCRGCGRTQNEVERWNTLSREKRIEINNRINSVAVRDSGCSVIRAPLG